LEVLVRTAIFKPANALIGVLLQAAADRIDAAYQPQPGQLRKGHETLQIDGIFGTFVGKGVASPPLPPRCRSRVDSLHLPACPLRAPGDPCERQHPPPSAPLGQSEPHCGGVRRVFFDMSWLKTVLSLCKSFPDSTAQVARPASPATGDCRGSGTVCISCSARAAESNRPAPGTPAGL